MFRHFKNICTKSLRTNTLFTPLLRNNFHTASISNKKLGVGEALAVLQDKISKITQLVSCSI